MKLTDEDYNTLSQTQLSDTNNVVIKIPSDKIKTDSDYDNYKYLQEKYIPSYKENLFGDTLGSTFFTGSSTQPSDTNIVEAWFTNDKIISNEYDPRYLQKQYIPSQKENLFGDTLGSTFFTGSSTQPSDTNIVEAWFTNDKIISNEYDPRYLQKQYIPPGMDSKKLELPSDINTHRLILKFQNLLHHLY